MDHRSTLARLTNRLESFAVVPSGTYKEMSLNWNVSPNGYTVDNVDLIHPNGTDANVDLTETGYLVSNLPLGWQDFYLEVTFDTDQTFKVHRRAYVK